MNIKGNSSPRYTCRVINHHHVSQNSSSYVVMIKFLSAPGSSAALVVIEFPPPTMPFSGLRYDINVSVTCSLDGSHF